MDFREKIGDFLKVGGFAWLESHYERTGRLFDHLIRDARAYCLEIHGQAYDIDECLFWYVDGQIRAARAAECGCANDNAMINGWPSDVRHIPLPRWGSYPYRDVIRARLRSLAGGYRHAPFGSWPVIRVYEVDSAMTRDFSVSPARRRWQR